MRRAAAVLLAFLILSGCTREEARARLQDDIPADTIDIIHARFPCRSPDSTFSVTDFASFRRGNSATATFVGTCQRGNGAGASCRGRASRASTLATSVRRCIDQEIAARQSCAISMAEPSRVRMPFRLPERSKKVLTTMRYRRRLLAGRMVGQSDRTTMVQGEQPADSAYDRTIGQGLAGECVQTPNICKCS
jgi:hypothetical protein